MNILYVASEVVPFCKTGGLADVAGSLPNALAQAGENVAVILPYYKKVHEKFGGQFQFKGYDYIQLSWRHAYCGLFKYEMNGVKYYLIDNEYYFGRDNLYGYDDDPERFAFFCRAVISMLRNLDDMPDVINFNDWQGSMIPGYLKMDAFNDESLRDIKTVLTIHNIEYQGKTGLSDKADVLGISGTCVDYGQYEQDGCVNLLKGAIVLADAITTVSPTYAQELLTPAFGQGLEGILEHFEYKMYGVLNGIDTVRYNPETDALLSANFTADTLKNRQENKAALQVALGLEVNPDIPVIGMVSRMVSHKGLDLVEEAFEGLMDMGVQVAILGQGDARYEEFYKGWAAARPYQVGLTIGYSDALAMSIYGGADLFLMPSKSEPCGLSQMIAMRYGCVPIVHEVGGLADTVTAYQHGTDIGNGFSFGAYNSHDMYNVVKEAVGLWKDYNEEFTAIIKRDMAGDFTWDKSAQEYIRIFESLN
ncbi:MAG: glycogen/starch synthase [Phascolarctobacterium sp.]|nr:glycogen/starch synthase [Phascolarctobacterium sp.]